MKFRADHHVSQIPQTATFYHVEYGYTSLEVRLAAAMNAVQNGEDIPTPRVPYARNAQERRILASIGDKLKATIKRAEKRIGPLVQTPEWNHQFFTFVARSVAVSRRERA